MDTALAEQLHILIAQIRSYYDDFNGRWEKQPEYRRINLKKKCVKDIYADQAFLSLVLRYVEFIRDQEWLYTGFGQLGQGGFVTRARVKARNSIEYKLEHYRLNHEDGTTPINKCLNDLYGMRIILKESYTHEQIKSFFAEYHPDLRCIESSKGGYIATHIYFRNGNYFFPWELQIWNAENQVANMESHKRYKQGYTQWEKAALGESDDK